MSGLRRRSFSLRTSLHLLGDRLDVEQTCSGHSTVDLQQAMTGHRLAAVVPIDGGPTELAGEPLDEASASAG